MAKQKKNDLPAALLKLQAYNNYRPTIWQELEADYPVPAGERCRYDGDMTHEFAEKLNDPQLYEFEIMALSNWRLNKIIYEFTMEMAEAVANTDEPSEIPVEILQRLPYNSFYVKIPENMVHLDIKANYEGGKDIDDFVDGFYVTYDYFGESRKLRLFMVVLTVSRKTMIYDVPLLPNKTVADIVLHKSHIEITNLLLKFLLYICTANADMQENPIQRQIYKPYTKQPKDRFQEVRKWDVGVRYTQAFKKYKAGESSGGGAVTKKRPHLRRGHYHHFWTGSKKDGSERQLVLKWLSPILVGTDKAEDTIVTVNAIKKE